jgi:iron-sulfur cluster assembly protein
MITVTPAAAEQIRASARQSQSEGLALRLAATRKPDGSIHYAMGFDDLGGENDLRFTSEQIEIVVAPPSLDLLDGTVVDFVELDSGKSEFVFMNPNDPNYVPSPDS